MSKPFVGFPFRSRLALLSSFFDILDTECLHFAVSESEVRIGVCEAPVNIRAIWALPDIVCVLTPRHYAILADASFAALERVLEKACSL